MPINDIQQRVFDAVLDCIRVCEQPRPGTAITTFAVAEIGGSNDLDVDGSVTPVVFNILPSPGKRYVVKTFVITMIDSAIKFNKFAGIPSLSAGLKVEIKEGGNDVGETANSPFKTNSQFYEAGLITLIQTEETDIFVSKLKVFEQFGTTLELIRSRSDFIKITVQDDLTNIDSFRILAQGYEVDE